MTGWGAENARRPAVRYVVIRRAHGHRCRAEGGVLPVPWPIACMAAVIHARRRLERNVVQAGRDERTRLRFSRISIARCADVIRSSASAWGPLSQSVHRVTGARATDQRPCAQDLRPGGACSTAEFLRREMADANGRPGSVWQAWTNQAGTAVARASSRRYGRQSGRQDGHPVSCRTGLICMPPRGRRAAESSQ